MVFTMENLYFEDEEKYHVPRYSALRVLTKMCSDVLGREWEL